jgi:hypothetical protein
MNIVYSVLQASQLWLPFVSGEMRLPECDTPVAVEIESIIADRVDHLERIRVVDLPLQETAAPLRCPPSVKSPSTPRPDF